MNFYYNIKQTEKELYPVYAELLDKVRLSSKADKHYAGQAEITEMIKPFKHLTMDEKYKIMAYSSYEIHGPFGKAVAVERDKAAPDVYLKNEYCLFQRIIPEQCYPVQEVIFCDGTPEGFFEVLLFHDAIQQLFQGYAEACFSNYIFSCEDVKGKRDLILEPTDWAPKYYKNYNKTHTLLLFEHSFDHGIELCEYSFSNQAPRFLQRDREYSHIEFEKGRFSDNQCCCCYLRKSICICEGEAPCFL